MTDPAPFASPVIDDAPSSRAPREWQGIPGIAGTADGALWATWYTGGPREPDAANLAVLERSTDDGATWTRVAEISAPGSTRVFDPNVWTSPDGRLWHVWNQTEEGEAELFDGRGGVWARHTEVREGEPPVWSEPRRLCNGVSMNKPLVTASGTWLLPASVWAQGPEGLTDEPREANVYASTDEGRTWTYRGGARPDPRDRTFDEHMVIQRATGELWMIIRTLSGLAESFSQDEGATWTLVRPSGFNPHTSSRVFFATLRDGTHVLVRNADPSRRDGLVLWASHDDGMSWLPDAVLDARTDLTYPDAAELPDGRLAVIYDRDRAARGQIVLRFVSRSGAGTSTGVPAGVSDAVVVSEK